MYEHMGIRVWIWLVAGVAVLAGTACSDSEPPGIQITGAIDAVYPISNGGTCLPSSVDGDTELAFSANPDGAQAAVGWVVASFVSAGAYSSKSHYVQYAGRTWTGKAGRVTVTSTGPESMSGTVSWTELHEKNGATLVNASGSWTCRIMLEPTETPTPVPPVSAPSPTPLPIGTPVGRQVLAPAKVLPVAALCSYKLTATADGNFTPLFCRSGALNVLAWRSYVLISPNLMSLGRSATLEEIRTAMCLDGKDTHATKPEEGYGYEISAAYYGWKFATDPATFLDEPPDPAHPVC
jgi:hypothetical protein